MTTKFIAVTFATVWACCPAIAQEAEPDLLLKEVVTGMPTADKQEIKVLTAILKPGDKTPFHTHAYPVTAYVLEGTFTLEMEGRAPITVKAGQSLVEPPNVKMTGYNRGTEPMKIVIFYVSGPNEPFLHLAH